MPVPDRDQPSSQPDQGAEARHPAVDGVDPLSYQVFQAFMLTLHLHRQLMVRILGAEGAHLGQAACMRVLAHHDGISQRDLADMLHLSRPTVTSMLQKMERGHVIERRADDADQRLTRVHLTPEGRQLERNLRTVLAGYISRTLDPMPADDRRELARLLRAMAENTERALE